MKPRVVLAYLFSLLVALGLIAAVLQLGQGLAPPASSTTPPAPPVDAVQSWLQGLRAQLDHPLSHLLVQLLVVIAAARGLGALFRRLGQPAVVGEMAAGILLGPSLFGWLAPAGFAFVFPAESLGSLKLLSQLGVCLFMFVVGMELDLGQLRRKAGVAVAVSHASIVLPYTLGVLLAYGLYSELAAPGARFSAFALFMGISMSITAFPVLARILQERGLAQSPLGQTALTCAAVDDVTAWSLMAFVVAVAQAGSLAGAALNLLLVAGFITLMLLGVRPLLARLIGPAALQRPEPSQGSLAAIVCLVVGAALCTELIGIHALFGAFLAGVVVPAAQGFRRKIGLQVENLSAVLLLPLFFAFTGLRTQIGLLEGAGDWLLCALIVAVATLGKLGGSALAARLGGLAWREALQLGALMNTRGLMELIALNVGYDLGILSPRIFTMLVLMALVTTMLTGPLLGLFARLSGRHHPPPQGVAGSS